MTKWGCFPVLAGKKKKLVEKPYNVALDLKKLNSSKGIESKVEVRRNDEKTVVDRSRKDGRAIENKPGKDPYDRSVKDRGAIENKLGEDSYEDRSGKDGRAIENKGGEDPYEGSDERDESPSIKREFSDSDLQDQGSGKQVLGLALSGKNGSYNSLESEATRSQKTDQFGLDLIQSGHVSDPGMEREEFWASPILKRSCSAFETRAVLRKMDDRLPLKKSRSFQVLQNSNENTTKRVFDDMYESPIMTPRSADNVMLKKHSSSQVLPSRSKKIWWKLFLWSHRNTHKPRTVKSRMLSTNQTSDQRGGYCSDTMEPSRGKGPCMPESPGSFSGGGRITANRSWGNFQGEASGSLAQNQWLAFSTESSSLARVDEWVSSVHEQTHCGTTDDILSDEGVSFPPSPENTESPARGTIWQTNLNVSEDVLHANNVIQSLNASSSVAHVTGMNLRVIPMISRFSNLRSVNLSGNYIVRITPGSLPKGIQELNLSRNKIATIEGLRDLTRLRVLDLSYNKITRIGQGLSNCTLIKELYLAGNKISILEGLHRLLKLTVLDLSFNKITTTKALGQLVANYNSLLALNLLGNPIQGNVGDEQVRKAILGLIPRLAYLNKQPIKREMAAMDSVAKAARGDYKRASYRKAQKQVGGLSKSASKGNLNRLRNKQSSNKIGASSLRRV